MTTFLHELEKYSEMEQAYQAAHPKAQPLGNFYAYFGLSKMMEILKEAEGREIQFVLEPTTSICLYSFA